MKKITKNVEGIEVDFQRFIDMCEQSKANSSEQSQQTEGSRSANPTRPTKQLHNLTQHSQELRFNSSSYNKHNSQIVIPKIVVSQDISAENIDEFGEDLVERIIDSLKELKEIIYGLGWVRSPTKKRDSYFDVEDSGEKARREYLEDVDILRGRLVKVKTEIAYIMLERGKSRILLLHYSLSTLLNLCFSREVAPDLMVVYRSAERIFFVELSHMGRTNPLLLAKCYRYFTRLLQYRTVLVLSRFSTHTKSTLSIFLEYMVHSCV